MPDVNACSVVNKLGFLVKLGPWRRDLRQGSDPGKIHIWGMAALLALGCGYHPAYGGQRPEARLSIAVAPSRAPESGALAAVTTGLRAELSRAGVLGPGGGYPRVVLELVRVDERGTAQLLTDAQSGGLPLASGALVGVTARAWVENANGSVERDTGDVRRTAAFGSRTDPGLDSAQREAALANAGRAVGEALGRRVMGEVDVTQEPM